MYLEKRYVRKVAHAFQMLRIPLRLVDAEGNCLVPEDGNRAEVESTGLAAGVNHRKDGWLIRPLDAKPPMALMAPAGEAGADDVLRLADVMLMSLLKDGFTASDSDVYRQALCQELTGADLLAQAAEKKIPLEMDRCVLLLQLDDAGEAGAYSLFSEMVPLTDRDVLVEMSRCAAALIKDMEDIDGLDELKQFAGAVQETVLEETGLQASIGIGEVRHTLAQLGESYSQACTAVEVGRAFGPQQGVYAFDQLRLERFLMTVPREEGLRYHRLLFNAQTAKLFNEEMLQTIEMFFQKDLNLSDTARQLFIHRNTLVYRLDKVQRQTGLDLRHFDDAVTFQILYQLKKCGMEP